jgi:outer membrane protein OmpA-like peptidoglycan-associated protein
MNRYAQTGAVAPAGRVALKAPSGMRQRVIGTGQTNVGGPESMGGAVVANFNSFQAGQPSVYANAAGLRPVAVVRFRGASSRLSADARQTVNRAADAFMARGGIGYVRIVGHAARHTGKLSLVRRMELDFRRAGVPAKNVLIDAVGSSQPANDGSASNGQNANRRAEIFLQG